MARWAWRDDKYLQVDEEGPDDQIVIETGEQAFCAECRGANGTHNITCPDIDTKLPPDWVEPKKASSTLLSEVFISDLDGCPMTLEEKLALRWLDDDHQTTDDVLENSVSDFSRIFYELGNDLIGCVRDYQNAAMELMIDKNADYGGDDDPLRNFRMSAQLGIPMTTGIALRLQDKFARLNGFISGNTLQVKSETIRDTLLDIMNYAAILLYAFEEGDK